MERYSPESPPGDVILPGASHEEAPFRFVVSFFKKEIELAGSGVAIQLLVPPLLLPFVDPSRDALEFFGLVFSFCAITVSDKTSKRDSSAMRFFLMLILLL